MPDTSDHPVVRSEVRGQCGRGHVVNGEVFGPTLPESWTGDCPLPGCHHAIDWERRPAYLPAAGLDAATLVAIGRRAWQLNKDRREAR